MRALTLGPHGGENLGDELILSGVAAQLQERGFAVAAMSSNPDATQQMHGLDGVQGVNVKHRDFATLRQLTNYDVVVVSGGEQIAAGRFQNPLWGHLANIFVTSEAARRQGVPFALMAVGSEEIKTPVGRWMLRRVLRDAAYVSARDEKSRAYLQALTSRPIDLTADPVFNLPAVDRAAARERVRETYGLDDRPLILFCPADDHRVDTVYVDHAATALKHAAEQVGGVVLVKAMDSQPLYDPRVLVRPVFEDPVFRVLPVSDPVLANVVDLIAGVDLVTGARMHPLIVAATQGTPWISLDRNAKLRNFATMMANPGIAITELPGDLAERTTQQLAGSSTMDPAPLQRLQELSRRSFDSFAAAVQQTATP